MLISALNQYYDVLIEKNELPPAGYEKLDISYLIALTEDGKLDHITDIRTKIEEKNKKGKIKGLPNEERPREKMIYQGKESLSNAELLAVLLRTGTREKSALELASDILSMNENGILHLEDCSIEELASIKGVGSAKACQVMAAIELGKRVAAYPRRKKAEIGRPEDIADLVMEKMRYYKKEHFCVLLLNTRGQVIEENEVSVGDLNGAMVHPREVFLQAVRRSAAAVALIHNHPSGDPSPSPEDVGITARLMESAEILGIKIVDHIIIGDGIYTSMKTEGLM